MQREFTPMNAAELMDKVVDVYKKSFWKQVAFAAILWAIGFAAIFVLTFILVFVFAMLVGFGTVYAGFSGIFYLVVFLGVFLLISPLFLIWQAFSGAGHILLSRQAFYGHKVRWKNMGLLRVIFRVFTALLAQAILIIPFILVVLGIIFSMQAFIDVFLIGGGNYPTLLMDSTIIIIVVVTLGLLFFGFIVYSHIYSLSIAVAVFEKRYFFGTVKRTLELIKGEFWRTLGVRVIWFIAAFGVSFSLQGIFMLAGIGWDLISGTLGFGVDADMFVSFILGVGVYAVGPILTAPLTGIMDSLIYFNQRMKKEGLDVEITLEKLSLVNS